MEESRSSFESSDLKQEGGRVRVKRRDGQVFIIKPERITSSPLDVEGVDLEITTDEIMEFIAESRRFS